MSVKKTSSVDTNSKIKIGVAIGCLAVAGLLLAYYFGLFEGDPAKIAQQEELGMTPEKREERTKQVIEAKQQQVEMEKRPGTVKAGS